MNENKAQAFDEWNAIKKHTHKKELKRLIDPTQKAGLPKGEL